MAYEPAHLRKIMDLGGEVGGNLWVLDGVDAVASVDTAGYITDARAKGMAKGDILLYRRWTTTTPQASSEKLSAAGSANILLGMHWYAVIGIGALGVADLSDGLAVTLTNTD